MKQEQAKYEEYIQCIGIWKKQNKEMEEKVNVKLMKLTIENKELKRTMVEWTTLQCQEYQELKKKEEAWNNANHAYQKALIEYKHKSNSLEKERELWLQRQDTKIKSWKS